ncbi:MAG: metalloregulator ArsR/SmtB family transcription factor [Cytophagales bacterium]|nr:metalloregulator ArsR/SmtB family transcription factor [Cytophagales bacterium]
MRLKTVNLSLGLQIFKAFSDESRIRILNLLICHNEMCISDIEQILDFTQTKTSRHLIYLKNSGILSTQKQDQWVYYYIKEEYMGVVSQVFNILEEKDPQLSEDLKTYRTLYTNNILAIRKLHNKQGKYHLPEL